MKLVYSLQAYSYSTVASESTVTWTVNIENACFYSVLDALSAFTTITTSVAGATTTQAFTDVKDSISKTYDTTATSYAVTSQGPPVVTSGPLKGTTLCGPRSYAITSTASCAALSLTYNTSPYYPILNLVSTDPTQVTAVAGTICTVTAKLPGHTTVPQVTQTVNVIIQPCILISFTKDAVNPAAQTYQMMGTILQVPFPTFTQSPACNYVITYTCQIIVLGVPSDYTTNANLFSMSLCDTVNKVFKVDIEKGGALTTLSAYIAKAGVYQIQVTATLNNSPAMSDTSFNFMLTVVNPCYTANTLYSTYTMTPMTTSVKAATQPVVQTITAYKDYASQSFGNGDGITLCGMRSYAVTQTIIGSATSLMANWFTLLTAATSGNNQVSVNSQNNNDIAYDNTPVIPAKTCNQMTLTVSLTDYPNVTPIIQTFDVCIKPCENTSFLPDTAIPALPMVIYVDSTATVNFPTYTQMPACGYPQTYSGTISSNSNLISYPLPDITVTNPYISNLTPAASAKPFILTFGPLTYTIKSTDMLNAGSYTLVLTATLVQDSLYSTVLNSDVTWQLTLTSACLSTIVNGNLVQVANMYNSVKAAASITQPSNTQTYTAYKDSISATYGAGALLCGPTTYTLGGDYTGSNTWMSFVNLSRTITVETNLDSDIKYSPSGYSVTIIGCLDNYPGVCSSPQSFTIEIFPCQVTSISLTGLTVTPNIFYKTFYVAATQEINSYTQNPACNYDQTYSFSVQIYATSTVVTPAAWLTLDKTLMQYPFANPQPTFSVFSTTFSDSGIYTVNQKVTLNDFYWFPAGFSRTDSFNVTVLDPCVTTQIIPQNGATQTFETGQMTPLITTSVKFGQDLPATIGTPKTKTFAFHQDSVSNSMLTINPSLSAQYPVCGPRFYTITILGPNPGVTVFQSIVTTGANPVLSTITSNDLDIGMHQIQLKVQLTNYLSIVPSILELFYVEIQSCIVNQITYTPTTGNVPAGNSPTTPIIFEIYRNFVTTLNGADFIQAPLCGYAMTYTQKLNPSLQTEWNPNQGAYVANDPNPPFFSKFTGVLPYQLVFASQTRQDDKCKYGVTDSAGVTNFTFWDTTLINPYYMNIVATLQPNPVPVNPLSVVLFNDGIRFYIWPKDPCNQAVLISDTPATMFTFVNSTTGIYQTLRSTNDSISLNSAYTTSGTGHDLCGQRVYMVNQVSGVASKYCTVPKSSDPPVLNLQTQDALLAGIQTIVFSTTLSDYPITSNVQFKVTIYLLQEGRALNDRYYQVGTSQLDVNFQSYIIKPTNPTFSIVYALRVTFLTGTTIGRKYENFELPPWVTFDAVVQKISILTQDAQCFGNYTISIVATCPQFLSVESLSSFLLQIVLTPPPIQPDEPPYFVTELLDQSFHWGASFSYTLPVYKDPELDTVTQQILKTPQWFKFSNSTQTFTVSEGSTSEKTMGIYTVNIKLSDNTAAFSDYSFKVEVKGDVIQQELVVDAINRPVPKIDSITPKGLVSIVWDQRMRTPHNLTYIQNGTTLYSNIAQGILDRPVPVLEVKVIRGIQSQLQNLNFTWEIKTFQQKTLQFQLWFQDPLQVSYQDYPEKLWVVFYQEDQFLSKDYGLGANIGPEYNLTRELPPQVSTLAAKQTKRTKSKTTTTTLNTVGGSVLKLCLFLLNQLQSLISTQQIIVMIPLFKINLQPETAIFFNYLMQIAAFDVIPTEEIFDPIFQIPVDTLPPALTENFDSVGFSTTLFFFNMGSLIFALIASPLLAIVAKILFQFKQYPKFIRRAKKIERGIYWSNTIRVLLESYTVIIVCCSIQSTNYDFGSGNWGKIFQSSVSMFYFAVCLALPFFQAIFCYKNFDKLDDEKFERKWGALWEGMKIKDKGFIAYNFTFLMRRLWLGLSVVFSREILCFQIIGFVYQIIISTIVTGQTRPYEVMKANNMEFFNEIMIMLVLYNFMCFTDWQPDVKIQEIQGYIACGCCLVHIGVNLVQIFQENVRIVMLRYKKYKLWRGYAKVRSEAMHNLQKSQKQKQLHNMRKFTVVEELEGVTIIKRVVNEDLESIQEVENSWQEDQNLYSFERADSGGSLESVSFDSAENQEQALHNSDNELRTAMISRAPAEAPKIVKNDVLEFMDNATKNDIAQNKLLALKRPVEFKQELDVSIHRKLGNKVAPDQMIPDPRAIMDELWGNEFDPHQQLVKKPFKEFNPIRFDKLVDDPHSKLARAPKHDLGVIPKRRDLEKVFQGKLKIQADKTKVHQKLFRRVEPGDGAKIPSGSYQDQTTTDLKWNEESMPYQESRHTPIVSDRKFERVVREILDEQPKKIFEEAKLAKHGNTSNKIEELSFDFGQ